MTPERQALAELVAALDSGTPVVPASREHKAARAVLAQGKGCRPLSEWHEDYGNVVWWSFPVNEPAWIGQPDDSDWPGYHTHWTPHPAAPKDPT